MDETEVTSAWALGMKVQYYHIEMDKPNSYKIANTKFQPWYFLTVLALK